MAKTRRQAPVPSLRLLRTFGAGTGRLRGRDFYVGRSGAGQIMRDLQCVATRISKVDGLGEAVVDWSTEGNAALFQMPLRLQEAVGIGMPGNQVPMWSAGGAGIIVQRRFLDGCEERQHGPARANHHRMRIPAANLLQPEDTLVPAE